MIQRRLSRRVRYVQLGHVGSGWLDPSTAGMSSFLKRLPALKAQYTASAKRNICVVYSHGMGIMPGDAGSVVTTYAFMVEWLNALRAGGQKWTVVVGLTWDTSNPQLEAFKTLVVKNAAALDISYFTELAPAQIAAIKAAPEELANLYRWNEAKARFGGHGSPLLYAMQSAAWAKAINLVL
jgi:hypothetical protein